MRQALFTAALAFALAAPDLIAADHFTAATNDFILSGMKHWQSPGLSIGVVKDGHVVFLRGFGVRDAESREPVDASTLFSIASCTKTFTAASIALLVDQRKLDWDDPVANHLPGLQFSDPYLTRHATLRDLLCHRTGLQRGDLLFTLLGPIEEARLIRRVGQLKRESEFRTTSAYSNPMFGLLAEVVAATTKQPWKRFVAENLFGPLEMGSTTFDIASVKTGNVAPRHWRVAGAIEKREWIEDAAAAGGVYSSAEDMVKWVQCQLDAGRGRGRQVISAESVREMHALQHSTPMRVRRQDNPYAARFYGAGLGWFALDYRGRKLVMHSGAWGAIIGLIPEENLGVVVLSNLDWSGLPGMLMYRVFDSYCADPRAAWRKDFEQFEAEGPGHAYRRRDRERARLQATRRSDRPPSAPLGKYVGAYRSPLYGRLQVEQQQSRLVLRVGPFTTELTHWEQDTFYGKSPTRQNFDWLVAFHSEEETINKVTLKHVGWKSADAVFARVSSPD